MLFLTCMKKRTENIIDIVPLTKIPLSRNQSFSYLSEKRLAEGTLVSIPLFRRKVEGIVVGSRPDFPRLGNIELKKINAVIEENFLDEKQLALAKFISDYYFSPLGIALKNFVPKRVKSRKQEPESKKQYQPKNIELNREQKHAVAEISKTGTSKKISREFLLYGPSGSGKTEVYIHTIAKLIRRGGQNSKLQFLVLLPELTLTPQAVERYSEYFDPEEITVLHSKIPKGQFYSAWQKIKSGKAKIIIGSRLAVFAPFKKLGLIIIDEEQDMSFKQWDMNPRYDARTVAEKLTQLHHCQIVFGSATPSLTSYFRAINKKIALLKLPSLNLKAASADKNLPAVIELVDMKKERWANRSSGKQGNYSSISKKLEAEIAYALKNSLQAILFVNRQGMSNFSVCADCKTALKCPRCDRALIYDAKGHYRCLHCAYQTSIMPKCPKCGGLAFRNIGLGTQKIEREIENLFPRAKVARADSQSMKDSGAQEKIYADFSQGKTDILIGTQMISKGWDLPRVALVGIIDADSLLTLPDFFASEKAYQTIIQLAGRVNRPGAKFPGRVIVQTFRPEQKFFKLIAEKNFDQIFNHEITERKTLNLPPFSKIIKLIFQEYDLKKVDSEIARVYLLLKNCSEKYVRLTEPQNSFVPKIRGRFRKQIIIKILNGKELPQSIKKLLTALPSGWIIDVDPVSVT